MLKNKKGFLTRDIIVIAILFSGVIALLVLGMGAMAVSYNRPDMVNQQFSNDFNKLQQATNGLNVSRNQVSSQTGTSFLGNFDIALSSTFTILNLVWQSVDIFSNAGSQVSSNFNFIPPQVVVIVATILISIMMVIIIFTILSSITRGRL